MSDSDAPNQDESGARGEEIQPSVEKFRGIFVSDRDSNVWPKILNNLYNSGGVGIVQIEGSNDGDTKTATPLIEELEDVSGNDFIVAIELMKRSGLVEQKQKEALGKKATILKLTKRGFEVAHERELAENQQESNESIAFFTLILAFTAILQTITAALQLNQVGIRIGILLIVLAITLLIALYNSQPREWVDRLRGTFR